MKRISLFLCGVFTLLLVLTISCQKDEDIIPTNPDAVVDYDPIVEGVFEGDETVTFPDDIEPERALETSFKDNETNSLSNSAISQAPDFSMEEFVDAFDKVSSDFPGIDKSSNEFAGKIIDVIHSSPPSERINNTKKVQINIF